ncbi:MAG: hypothetical protein QM208_00950 [Bacillota bacterium]|mgnify:CR=1 FL=1|jgi:hypothetical protein|nr:hypothetical protein [Bacillota bacterium]HQC90200.1 hypothetical protein [Bacilli bacterium]
MKKLCWIEKLNGSLKHAVDDETREKIMEGVRHLLSSSSPGTKAKMRH